MAILSPIMTYIVDKELGFPVPSEKEKINKALRKYKYILLSHPLRSDAPEIMFGIADLLVGRNEPGDYAEAMKYYDKILLRNVSDYLRARALVGKAELLIGEKEEFNNAISLCEKARKLLGGDMSDFFTAKTYAVEAELRLARQEQGDWAAAVALINKPIKDKSAHWYFRGRALLCKAEILFYRDPGDLPAALKLCDEALKEMRSRPDDYFSHKGKLLKAEIVIRRDKAGDLERAEDLLTGVVKMPFKYSDLIARAKLDLADIVNHPQAARLVKEVAEMEGLDPYLVEKARLSEAALKDRKKKPVKK